MADKVGQPHDTGRTAVTLLRVRHRLTQLGWFIRTWTVQEYIIARQSVFAFGDEAIDTRAAVLMTDLAKSHMRVQRCCSDYAYRLDRVDNRIKGLMNQFVDMIEAFEWLLCVANSSNEVRRLSERKENSAAGKALKLLAHGRRRHCADPRDKIYALLGVTWGALGALRQITQAL